MMEDRLLSEVERQEKYLAKLLAGFGFPLFNARRAGVTASQWLPW